MHLPGLLEEETQAWMQARLDPDEARHGRRAVKREACLLRDGERDSHVVSLETQKERPEHSRA